MRSKAELEDAIRSGGRAVLIVNTRSRRGRHRYVEALRLLIKAGVGFVQLHPVHDPARLPEVFERALELKPDLIVVGGGVSKHHSDFLPLLDLRTTIVPAKLRNAAGIVGAAALAAEARG